MTINVSDLVDKWYEMDPETEDVVPNGNHLYTGMVVLLEDPAQRMDTRQWASWGKEDWRYVKMRNRWGKILHIGFSGEDEEEINLLMEFKPGEKMSVSTRTSAAWLVKKHSIPSNEEMAKRLAEQLFPGMQLLATYKWSDLFGNKPAAKPKCPGFDLATGKPCIFDEGHRFEGLLYCSDGHEKETTTEQGEPAFEKKVDIQVPVVDLKREQSED